MEQLFRKTVFAHRKLAMLEIAIITVKSPNFVTGA